jgi:isopropylmalate/homocitrate/citramalate synthase
VALDRLVPLARLAEELTGQRLADHHPITGRRVFEGAGSDEYVQEYKYDLLMHCSLSPELVGNVREPSIAKDTGPFTMWDRLDAAGVELEDRAMVERILVACKGLAAEKRRDLTAAEVREMAQAVLSPAER